MKVQKVEGNVVVVDAIPPGTPHVFHFSIDAWKTTDHDVLEALQQHWEPIWNRGDPDDQAEHPPGVDVEEPNLLGIPQLPGIVADTFSMQEWREAIRRTKPMTSKGMCGFSRRELHSLPDDILKDLLDILRDISQGAGWPEILVSAKTVFIPKTSGVQTADSVRPITVFSLLFRCWSKILTRRLLTSWKQHFPTSVGGGMPGTAADLTWWQVAAEVDSHNHAGDTVYGFVLDLKRCFNMFCRQPVRNLLIHFGAPAPLVDMWLAAINSSVRYLVVNGAISQGLISTHGVPEGDPMGVAVMCAFSAMWTWRLHDQVQCYTYADNWEWIAPDVQNLCASLAKTRSILPGWGQQIAFHKSWAWSNTSAGRKTLRGLAQRLPGGTCQAPLFDVKLWAPDLGATVLYAGHRALGSQPDRFEEAIRMTGNLKKLPLDADQRARAIRGAILPVALHGCEILCPSPDRMASLRTVICETLVGQMPNAHRWMATSCLSTHNLDPLFNVAKRLLSLVRRACLAAPSLLERVWTRAIAFLRPEATGRLGSRAGPSATLARVAQLMGWRLEPGLCVVFDSGLRCHVDTSDKATLALCLEASWNNVLTEQMLKRRQWEQVPCVDARMTSSLFTMHQTQDKAILRHVLVGTAYGDAQRKHVGPGEKCLCGQLYTEQHSLFQCSITRECLDHWTDWIDSDPVSTRACIQMPIFPSSQAACDLLALRLAEDLPGPTFTCHPDHHEMFWTDGSMNRAQAQIEREATWAIVRDKCCGNPQREAWAQTLATLPCIPHDAFAVCQVGGTPGLQTINRAELLAVAVIVQAAFECTVIVDSQYCVNLVTSVLRNPDPILFWNCANFDIVLRICTAAQVRKPRITLEKIKSHQVVTVGMTPLEKYLIQGNALADLTAGVARTEGFPHTRDLLRGVQKHYALWRSTVAFAMHCRIDLEQKKILARDRARMTERRQLKDQSSSSSAGGTKRNEAVAALTRRIPNPVLFELPDLPESVAGRLYWGSSYTHRLLAWLRTLKWDSSEQPNRPDITFYELLVNFLWTTQAAVPVNLGTKNQPRFATVETDPHVAAQTVTVAKMLHNFQDSLQHLGKILQVPLWPAKSIKKAMSLYRIYGCQPTWGLDSRPQMLCQDEMCQALLKLMFDSPHRESHGVLPSIPRVQPLINLRKRDDDLPDTCAEQKRSFRRWTRARALE